MLPELKIGILLQLILFIAITPGCHITKIGRQLATAILLVETLAIREAVLVAIQENMGNVIIETDYQIAIPAITRVMKVSSLITNIIRDIEMLAPIIRNIKFEYFNKYPNKLADKIAAMAYYCTT